jgi:3-oxoacyl-[acyl-carrier-protein] synthase-3
VDVYVPHQANVRIMTHAAQKLGIPQERMVWNVIATGTPRRARSRSRSADAAADGRLQPGKLVLMTGMGAGLTWGSALMRWTMNGVPA